MSRLRDAWRRLKGVQRFSPEGFLLYAFLLIAFYLMLDTLGLRTYTSIVCGNPEAAGGSVYVAVALGLLYIVSHFGGLCVAPVLLIAAAAFAGLAALTRRRH